MKIKWLENKEFVVSIQLVVDAEVLLSEGMEDSLDNLRGIGQADIEDIELRDKPNVDL